MSTLKNKAGRTYENGKPLSNDFRRMIIDELEQKFNGNKQNHSINRGIRLPLFQKAGEHKKNFNTLIAEDKLIFIMQNKDLQFLLGSTLSKMFARRKTFS